MTRFLGVLAAALVSCTGVQAATQVETETLRLTFDGNGGLQSAVACFPSCSAENTRLQQFADDALITFEPFTGGQWTRSTQSEENEYRVRFEHSSGAVAEWAIPARGYLVKLKLDAPGGVSLKSGESFRPREAAGFGAWLEQSRYVVMGAGDVTQIGYEDESEVTASDSQWIGYRNRYWTLVASPPATSEAVLETSEEQQDARLLIEAEPGAWSFYLGPIEPGVMKQAAEGLDQMLFSSLWFWLRWICLGLFTLLGWINTVIPSWGLSIIILSLAVGVLMMPLTRIAERYQQEVHDIEERIAPEMQRIKQKYKGQKQSEKILALYKTENVHPLYSLKGMLGILLIIPVFIGAFNMLAENIHLLNTPFLWMADLSRSDSLFMMPFRLPFFGAEFNLLPFLMTGLSVVASALHQAPTQNPQLRKKQLTNMILMAVLFFALFYTFPAGMVLYWTTNNLISVTKSLWARR
jgi:YidC/Oxa1 family membrane protein insertase